MEAATGIVAPPALEPAGRWAGHPRLAAGLELLGEMRGSGYRQAPALARRSDGQVIKLTGLLYQLIELIDGRRGYEELAAGLSERIGKRATADDVEYLIEKKLRPLGVLQQPDGSEPALVKANPLLALRLRAILSKPELTRRLTTPFAWLFAPAIVVPVLAGFALLCWWLLTAKGLSAPLHQAFYDPVMILAVWGLLIVSAAFHELGHASACRYGGARPGVMGAGIYLAWPVFYTEVSDAYRLDRRGRLRVDLGGLYFNAIFALLTGGLWALTGNDAVLLVIPLMLAQMLRQLAPFIRADGYHIAADLTGVPDLFAHIKPTLLGLLPWRWGRGGQSRLKPWARVLVSGWVLLIAPVLAGMLLYMVLVLPRLAATAWDSMGIEWAAAGASWGKGDPAAVAVSLISAGLVALPVLGITYMLGRFARRSARKTWLATSGRPALRALSLVAATLLLGAVALAWWPSDRYQPIRANESGPVPSVAPSPSASAPTLELAAAASPTPTPTAPAPAVAPRLTAPATPPQSPLEAPPTRTLPSAAPAAPKVAGQTGGSAWPFPFDPPDQPGPGDNQARSVNTTDNSSVMDLALSLLVLTQGNPVDNANEAYALASCQACTTVAVAFQVIVIVGYVDQITPENAAVAVNYDCQQCTTAAFAYQIITSLPQAPSPQLIAQLNAIIQRLQVIEQQGGSLTPDQIFQLLEGVKQEVLQTIAQNGGSDTSSTASGDSRQNAGQDQPSLPAVPLGDTTSQPAPSSDSGTQTTTDPSSQQTTTTPDSTGTTTTDTTTTPSACPTGTDPATDPSCPSQTTTTTPDPAPAP